MSVKSETEVWFIKKHREGVELIKGVVDSEQHWCLPDGREGFVFDSLDEAWGYGMEEIPGEIHITDDFTEDEMQLAMSRYQEQGLSQPCSAVEEGGDEDEHLSDHIHKDIFHLQCDECRQEIQDMLDERASAVLLYQASKRQ